MDTLSRLLLDFLLLLLPAQSSPTQQTGVPKNMCSSPQNPLVSNFKVKNKVLGVALRVLCDWPMAASLISSPNPLFLHWALNTGLSYCLSQTFWHTHTSEYWHSPPSSQDASCGYLNELLPHFIQEFIKIHFIRGCSWPLILKIFPPHLQSNLYA